MNQLCAGLKHMHSFDPPYAHNDVKPGNVLITHRKGQAPVAILMDFGSARPARRQIRSRTEALQLQVLASFLFKRFNPLVFLSCVPQICFHFLLWQIGSWMLYLSIFYLLLLKSISDLTSSANEPSVYHSFLL